MNPKTKWLLRNPSSESHNYKLFCFPYAGGTANIYRSWQDKFHNCEVIGIEPPGRGSRLLEPPISDIYKIVSEILPEIEPLLDTPFSFFGHSNGALMAFELTRTLQKFNLPLPEKLFLSAKNPPHNEREEKISHLPRQEFIAKLESYNGTNPEVLKNDELLDLVLPTLRADFSIAETYTLARPVRLNTELHVFSGTQDPYVDIDSLSQWSDYSNNNITPHFIEGDHFYFNTDNSEVCRAVSQRLLSAQSC